MFRSKEKGREMLAELVERFRRNRDHYGSTNYNEETARGEFITPLFEALGWDVTNRAGNAEAYKDVVHEESVKVGDLTKAPDYTFRVGGQRKFFVEAKKPFVDLKNDPAPAYQLRRYAWSAKLPVSILTDFEELAVYDTRRRPFEKDKAAVCRIQLLSCDEFLENFEDLWNTFSKEAVYKGSFDRWVEEAGGKRGTSEVDAEFLKELEGWRDELARNFALRNPGIGVEELNFAVQTTIDRILFLRVAESRGVEPPERLRSLVNGDGVYIRLAELFERADVKYNSGLFDFRTDRITLELHLDDKVLRHILGHLYYPESPYEFSVLPPEILGNVYEQFLGKVIRLTAGGHAKVEEKPEVKKAGGVYYTPSYIVDYIVRHTVGKLTDRKSPKEMAKLRILDPACGSGSFLLRTYQHLLDAHLAWYRDHDPPKHKKELYLGRGGEWRLTLAEKRRILVSSIHGVDIDRQAVEVTKLSLLLAVMEGEPQASFLERALPSLEKNIKCGNSLIGHDAFKGQLFPNPEDLKRINPFDWNHEFPDILKSGGFDAVIGNPPYGALFTSNEKSYLFGTFPEIVGQPESYEYFLIRSLALTRESGFMSFIVPTNFVESQRAEGLRQALLSQTAIEAIHSFRYNVWKGNASETLVIRARKGIAPTKTLVSHPQSPGELADPLDERWVPQVDWRATPGKRFILRADSALLRKIEAEPMDRLGTVCEVAQGIIAYKTREDGRKNLYISASAKSKAWRPLLDTTSRVGRYELEWGGKYIKYGPWLWCPREPKFFESEKLLFVRLRNKSLPRRLVATLDAAHFYNRDNFNNIIGADDRYPLFYVLALFNSKLLNYWYRAHFDNVNINPAQVRLLPLKRIDQGDKRRGATIAAFCQLVEQLLEVSRRLSEAKTSHERVVLERRRTSLDAKIDELVYGLYKLTQEEIEIVERATERVQRA